MKFIRRAPAIVIVHASCLAAWAQGPNTETPQQLILPWTDAEISERAEACYSQSVKLYAEIDEEIAKYEKAIADGKPKTMNLIAMGSTRAKLGDAERYATRLTYWGEPAGQDLTLRYGDFQRRWDKIWTVMTDTFQAPLDKGFVKLQRQCETKRRAIPALEKLLADGKAELAEKKFDSLYFDLHRMACWYDYRRRDGPMLPYDQLRERITTAVNAIHQQEADQTLPKLRDAVRPDLTDLPQSLSEAADALQTSAQVSFGEEELDGPKLFMTAARQWYAIHRDMLRLVGLTWADWGPQDPSAPSEPALAQYAPFCQQMTKSLQAVIDADTARASADEVAELHAAYVEGIAEMLSITRDDAMVEQFAASLDRLAEKSPQLAAQVRSYRGATDDWLRWRRKAAENAAAARRGKATELPTPMVRDPLLHKPGPLLLTEIAAELANKTATATVAYLVPGKTPQPTSNLLQGCYVQVRTTTPVQDETLAADLLATDDLPPLSLQAAHALAANKRGNLAEAEGAVAKITLVGMVPLFVIDSDEHKAIAGMGALPPLANGTPERALRYVRAAIEIEPAWVRSDYFFKSMD